MNALKTVRRAFTLFGIAVWLVTFVYSAQAAESKRRVPTIEDLLLVRSAGNAKISPDGKWVVLLWSTRRISSWTLSSRTSGWPTHPPEKTSN